MKVAFHLALPCKDIIETKSFYLDIVGANEGRSAENWVDIDLYDNQLTFTTAGDFNFNFKNYMLNGKMLPSFHFGVIIDIDTWQVLYDRLSLLDLDITTEVTFLENKIGEHLSFFITDPNGYTVEFKCFKNANEVFSK